MPQRADGYQATSGFSSDSSLRDHNAATGYERTGSAGSNISITAKLDLGASPTACKFLKASVKYANAPTIVTEYSDDDSSYISFPVTPIPIHLATYSSESVVATMSAAASHRYWRLSLRDTASGVDIPKVGVMEIWAEDSSGAEITEPTASITISAPLLVGFADYPPVGLASTNTIAADYAADSDYLPSVSLSHSTGTSYLCPDILQE